MRDTTDDGDGAGDVWENIISMLINVNKSNRKRITTIIQTIIFNIFHFYTYDADYNDILSETTPELEQYFRPARLLGPPAHPPPVQAARAGLATFQTTPASFE